MTVVYTIGYEGTDIERFVATLKTVGVKALADVRAVAISRKKGFSKSALRDRLEAEGIAYVHFVELGDPKPGREAAKAGKYDLFRRIYTKHLHGNISQESLRGLENTARQMPTALLCFERDPTVCHRSIVSDTLALSGIRVLHLYGDDPKRYVRNSSKLPRGNIGQGAASAKQEAW